MKASGILEPGFSFQMGVGGASLAVAKYLGEYMKGKKVSAAASDLAEWADTWRDA